MNSARRIYRSSSTSNEETRELLQAIFTAELLLPSSQLWLISPWVTDLEILDNRSGGFAAFNPRWEPRNIRLVEILGRLIELGSRVVIATRPDSHNDGFVQKLRSQTEASGQVQHLTIHRREELHWKGLLGTDFYLSGSMNITFNGVEILDESVLFETSRDAIGQACIQVLEKYGGGHGSD